MIRAIYLILGTILILAFISWSGRRCYSSYWDEGLPFHMPSILFSVFESDVIDSTNQEVIACSRAPSFILSLIEKFYDDSPKWRIGWYQTEGSLSLPQGRTLVVVPIEK